MTLTTAPAVTDAYSDLLNSMASHLADAVQQYRISAPVVSQWADDLYIRMGEDRATVTLEELFHAMRLRTANDDPRGWMDGAYAANYITKLMYAQGRDVTGLLYE